MGEWNIIRETIENQTKANNQQYKEWSLQSKENNITAQDLKDYKLREKVINEILNYIVTNNLNGINIKNIYEENNEDFSRFLIELKPRLNEIGVGLTVD